MRCETCQEEAPLFIEVIGCYFCESCLKKIDNRIAEINRKKRGDSPSFVFVDEIADEETVERVAGITRELKPIIYSSHPPKQ